MRAANDAALYAELAERGGDPTPRVTWTHQPLRSSEDESFQIASLIPLILILMTITGAVYPAIDLTAGERERGTLEALMAAPVPRLGLLLAKYFAVLAVACAVWLAEHRGSPHLDPLLLAAFGYGLPR